MNVQFDLVAWDFDGTLADSRTAAFERAGDIAALFGPRPAITTMAEYRQIFARLEQDFAPEDEYRAALRALHRVLMRSNARVIQPFPAIMGIAARLRSRSVIVTAALRGTVLTSLGLHRRHFSTVHGAEDGPKEAVLARLAKKNLLLYATDTTTDLRRCAEVGVRTIAVGWGYDSPDDLIAARPNWLVHTPTELADVLAKLDLLKEQETL